MGERESSADDHEQVVAWEFAITSQKQEHVWLLKGPLVGNFLYITQRELMKSIVHIHGIMKPVRTVS